MRKTSVFRIGLITDQYGYKNRSNNVLKRVSLCYGVQQFLANYFRTCVDPKFITIINTIFWESKITA